MIGKENNPEDGAAVDSYFGKKILACGRFEQLGLAQAQALKHLATSGQTLVVGVATQSFCARLGQTDIPPLEQRLNSVAACRYVDRVIALHHLDQLRADIINLDISELAIPAGWHAYCAGLSDLTRLRHFPDPLPAPARFHLLRA